MQEEERTSGGRRISVQDVLAATTIAVVATLGTLNGEDASDGPRVVDAGAGVLAAVAGAALVVRRRFPVATQLFVTAVVAAYVGLGYPFGPILGVLLLAILNAAWEVEPRRSLAATGVSLVACAVAAVPRPGPQWLFVAWFAAAWAIGALLHGRREAREAREAELRRRRAYDERLRIAREVHDVVGHGLSVIAMQAGVALHVLDRRPDDVRASLEAIRDTSTSALDGLRSTLAVLRDEGQAAERAPLPSLADLDRLADGVRAAGLDVDVAVSGEERPLPDAVDHAAFRIVQESLTNAVRHGGARHVRVGVAYGPSALEVEVTDDGRGVDGPPRDGDGLAGMRERARALAGTLEAGGAPGGGFRVRATLPVGGTS